MSLDLDRTLTTTMDRQWAVRELPPTFEGIADFSEIGCADA